MVTSGGEGLWQNAKIEIVPLDQVPFQTTVRVWVPLPILEDEAILTLIKRQNKELVQKIGRFNEDALGTREMVKISGLKLVQSHSVFYVPAKE